MIGVAYPCPPSENYEWFTGRRAFFCSENISNMNIIFICVCQVSIHRDPGEPASQVV